MAGTVQGSSYRIDTGGRESFGVGFAKDHSTVYTAQNATGTADGQIDRIYTNTFSINASGSTTLDLRSLTGPDGSTYTFAEVTELTIVVDTDTTLHLGNAASNAWANWIQSATALLTVPGKGVTSFNTTGGGIATASDNKSLKILNSSGSTTATGTITIKGRSA